MISALIIINHKGEVVIHRIYRDDVTKASADAFRMQVVAKKEAQSQPPIKIIDNSSFLYTRHENLYFIAVTKSNVNPCMVFQFIFQFIKILQAYFGNKFTEEKLKSKYNLVYELLDECIDFGYPQNCAIDVLKLYINLGAIKNQDSLNSGNQLTSQITGAIDWRRQNIKYKKNEIFIDILEKVNLLLGTDGNILRSDVTGQVNMKAYLTGMPECKFGLNDKLILDREETAAKNNPNAPTNANRPNRSRAPGVEIDDCTFHRCVKLGKFDADRTITFIPPDGEFELMKYRITDNINLPFRVIPVIQEEGRHRVVYHLKVIGDFSAKLHASNVTVKIPVPSTTARVKILNASRERAKYQPAQSAIIWRIRRFDGKRELSFNAVAEIMASTSEKAWSRPPISVEFQVPMFTASGLRVRFLHHHEMKHDYKPIKWVRYITRGGSYQIRI